jgi:hypothetical protein
VAEHGCFTRGVVLVGRWVLQQYCDAVLVPLVEDVRGREYSLACGNTALLVDLDVHHASSRSQVTGNAVTPYTRVLFLKRISSKGTASRRVGIRLYRRV